MKALLAIFFILVGCGTQNNQANPSQKTLRLELFSAPYCGPCNAELPELQKELKSRGIYNRVNTKVWMTAVRTPLEDEPSPQEAQSYKQKLGIDFQVQPDQKWKEYRRYYKTGKILPAGILFNDQGVPLKVFEPAQFKPKDVLQRIETELRK